jgi:hypothetical protein
MPQQPPTIAFEDVPLEEARKIGRGSRMDPALYHALRTKIQLLTTQAVRMPIPAGTSPVTLKNRILRVALELKMTLTIRKVPNGLLFWRSTDDDLQQAHELSSRLQTARHKQLTLSPGRARRTTAKK